MQSPGDWLEVKRAESFTTNTLSSEYGSSVSQAQELIEQRHLHPSIITLSKDPYKSISISEYSKSRVVCASLEQDDHNVENE